MFSRQTDDQSAEDFTEKQILVKGRKTEENDLRDGSVFSPEAAAAQNTNRRSINPDHQHYTHLYLLTR